MKFIHCSDIHLGKSLNSNRQRYLDYFNAFRRVAELAVEKNVDCLIIAGDLFHDSSVSPTALADAVEILEILKSHNIPVVAIEGNHDRFHRRNDESWLLYLSRRRYINLLRPTKEASAGEIYFEPFDEKRGWGGWIEIAGKTIYGLGYWAETVSKQIERASKNLPQKADIAILHAGVWNHDFIDIGKISTEDFLPMSGHFRYVALGHGHSQYEIKDSSGKVFGFNPGSLEIVNREESLANNARFGRVYLVELGDENFNATPVDILRRPYINVEAIIEGACTPHQCMEKLKNFLESKRNELNLTQQPVLNLDLIGKINFNSTEIDISECEKICLELFNPVVTIINNRTSLISRASDLNSSGNIEDVFKQTIKNLIDENSKYSTYTDSITRMIYKIQEMVEQESDVDSEITDYIHQERMNMMRRDEN